MKMKYKLMISEDAEKKFQILEKRDKQELAKIAKKIEEIKDNPLHFRPISKDARNTRVAELEKGILIFAVMEKHKTILILDFDNQKEIYEDAESFLEQINHFSK